jgi:Flp pilus assembly protein TadD
MSEAVTTVERAYRVAPEDPQVRWAFGLIMLQARRRTDEAVKAWESLVAEEPDLAERLRLPERLESIRQFMK